VIGETSVKGKGAEKDCLGPCLCGPHGQSNVASVAGAPCSTHMHRNQHALGVAGENALII
jgi:hypothetical protein